MTITVDNVYITISGERLRYDPFWLEVAAEHRQSTARDVLLDILRQWADALEFAHGSQTLYLPYSFDDEWIECLEAKVEGDDVVTTCIVLRVNAYEVDIDDLSDFAYGSLKFYRAATPVLLSSAIESKCESAFGKYDKADLIAALRSIESKNA